MDRKKVEKEVSVGWLPVRERGLQSRQQGDSEDR